MRQFGEFIGDIERLEDVLEAVVPWDHRVRVVEHDRSGAFTLIGVPNWVGETAGCEARIARDDARVDDGEDKGYGDVYITVIKVDTQAGEPAVLYLGWIKQAGEWSIFSYKVVEP